MKIAHIINPVRVKKTSDLYAAQPVTFEAMKQAREFAAPHVEVEQYAAAFPEDQSLIPGHLQKTSPLDRSIMDFPGPNDGRKLPLIKDILDRLYQQSRADYVIYTNVDIAPMPHFYVTLDYLIRQGYDTFIVNRRTIPGHYSRPSDVPLMYAELGDIHPGSDCFVFKRELYPHYILGNVVIGCEFFGLTMRTNTAVMGEKFAHFRDYHMTFHIGDDKTWKRLTNDALFNQKQLEIVFRELLQSEHVKNSQQLRQFHSQFNARSKQLRNRIEKRKN